MSLPCRAHLRYPALDKVPGQTNYICHLTSEVVSAVAESAGANCVNDDSEVERQQMRGVIGTAGGRGYSDRPHHARSD